MSSDRPYRKVLAMDQCLADIDKDADTHFDLERAQVLLGLAATDSL